MKPITVPLNKVFEGNTQYAVDPVYRYTVTTEEWEAFWQAVLRISADPWNKTYQLGKLELQEIPPDAAVTSKYLILQGENNVVTSQVFLYALYDEGLRRGMDTITFVAPLGILLMFPSGEIGGANSPKLHLAGDDEALINIAAGKMREECGEPFTALAGCYKFFQAMLRLQPSTELMRFREVICSKFVVELRIEDAKKPFMPPGTNEPIQKGQFI